MAKVYIIKVEYINSSLKDLEPRRRAALKHRRMERWGGTKGRRGGQECPGDFKTKVGASEGF